MSDGAVFTKVAMYGCDTPRDSVPCAEPATRSRVLFPSKVGKHMPDGVKSGASDRAATYRARAVELRAVAALLHNAKSREMILSTAADYERMASALERAAERTKNAPPKDED